MVGIDFSSIPVSWKDCTGYSRLFASEQIETFVQLPFSAFTTQHWNTFISPQLKEALFHEIQHYVDRSLYHLIVGKGMVCDGKIAWGLVSYYYSAFFAAQAAIRLKGVFFVKVNYESETNVPPTHRLEVVNLLRNEFRIRRAGPKGEHQRVWFTFYESFGSVSSRASWARYAPVTAETDPELRLTEMHRRHLVNYVPGQGYVELRSPKDADKLQKELSVDVFSNQAAALEHQDCQLEIRAFLRLSFCLQMLSNVARQGGIYQLHHPRITERRRAWMQAFKCPPSLSGRIEPALAS